MLPSRISPLRSPAAAASASHFQWQPPMASPFQSCHHTPLSSINHTPILNSPISPYLQLSPSIRPTLSDSPEKGMPNYPPIYAGGARYSPSLHKVRTSITIYNINMLNLLQNCYHFLGSKEKYNTQICMVIMASHISSSHLDRLCV